MAAPEHPTVPFFTPPFSSVQGEKVVHPYNFQIFFFKDSITFLCVLGGEVHEIHPESEYLAHERVE